MVSVTQSLLFFVKNLYGNGNPCEAVKWINQKSQQHFRTEFLFCQNYNGKYKNYSMTNMDQTSAETNTLMYKGDSGKTICTHIIIVIRPININLIGWNIYMAQSKDIRSPFLKAFKSGPKVPCAISMSLHPPFL